MNTAVTPAGIDAAVTGLSYANPDAPKARLAQAVRAIYDAAPSPEAVGPVDPDRLIPLIWDTGDDPAKIRARRKNFNSVKSSLNQDLKRLYDEGNNPEGVTLGPDNVFTMSDEARDRLLHSFTSAIKPDEGVTLDKVADALNLINDLLSGIEAGETKNAATELDRIRDMLRDMVAKTGAAADFAAPAAPPPETAEVVEVLEDAGPEDGGGQYEEVEDFEDLEEISEDELDPEDLAALEDGDAGYWDDDLEEEEEEEAPEEAAAGETDEPTAAAPPSDEVVEIVEILEDDDADEPADEEGGDGEGLEAEGPAGADETGEGDEPEDAPAGEDTEAEAEEPEDDDADLEEEPLDEDAALEDAEGPPGEGDRPGFTGDGPDGGEVEELIEILDDSGPSDDDEGPGGPLDAPEGEDEGAGDDADAEPDGAVEEIDAADDAGEVLEEDLEAPDLEDLEEPLDEDAELEDAEGPPGEGDRPGFSGDGPDGGEVEELLEILDDSGPSDDEEGPGGPLDAPEGEDGGAGDDADAEADGAVEEIDETEDTTAEDLEEPDTEELEAPLDDDAELEDAVGPPGDGDAPGFPGPDGDLEELLEILDESGPADGEEGPGGSAAESGLSEEETELVDEEELADAEEVEEGEDDFDEDEYEEASDLSQGGGEGGESEGEGPVEELVEILDPDEALETGEGPGGPLEEGEDAGPGDASVDEDEEGDIEDADEDVEYVDDLPKDAELEDAGGFPEPDDAAPILDGVGLPMDDFLEEELGPDGITDDERERLLSERFDGYLGTMDRYYNQYLLIPAGKYPIGAPPPAKNALTPSEEELEAFYMGKYPITNALFEVFVERTGYRTLAEEKKESAVYYGRFRSETDPDSGRKKATFSATFTRKSVRGACWYQPFGPGSTLHEKRSHPVVHIAWRDAAAFAAWTGKRLPSEIQWEAAARTTSGRDLPWGDEMQPWSNIETAAISDTTPVNHFPEGVNSLGIADTHGNVLEWTMDVAHPPYARARGGWRVARGGSFISDPGVRLYTRFVLPEDETSNILGFRCLAD